MTISLANYAQKREVQQRSCCTLHLKSAQTGRVMEPCDLLFDDSSDSGKFLIEIWVSIVFFFFFHHQMNGIWHCDDTGIATVTQHKYSQLKTACWKCLVSSVYIGACMYVYMHIHVRLCIHIHIKYV